MVISFYFPGILPVQKYGGTERIIFWLMKELVKQKHTVYLIGNSLSKVSNIGVKLIPCNSNEDWRILIPRNTDIIHTSQNTLDIDLPYVNTIHGNEKNGIVFPLNSVFVSSNHAYRHDSNQFVLNGIDLDEYPLTRDRSFQNKNYLFLANGRWNVKNLRDCICVSNDLKKDLYVAGASRKDSLSCFREKNKYFNQGLLYYFSKYDHYLGMLEQSEKLPLLNKIDALLWPVRWHEPFGIAIIEAYSQGIPIFGSRYGSLPEIVPEFCGVLSDNYQDFKNSLSNTSLSFDSREIRNYCIENFSSIVMANNYIKLYETVLSGQNLNKVNPHTNKTKDTSELLPF